jgi:acyl-coenzyme A synthetase/AMP-(fatty) acid ligase
VPYPIGSACDHCDALVLDETLQEVPSGGEGLLYIAGPSVFLGYWNRPEQNRAAFIERDGRRWYNTGDVVREEADSGFAYIGRRDRMVKRRGYRIELGEIERGLYKHSAVAEVGVVAVPDNSAGVRIVACLSTGAEKRPSIVQMKVFSGGALPSYMSPDVFLFFDKLPRTSTNKIDYQRLAKFARGEEPIPPVVTYGNPNVSTRKPV